MESQERESALSEIIPDYEYGQYFFFISLFFLETKSFSLLFWIITKKIMKNIKQKQIFLFLADQDGDVETWICNYQIKVIYFLFLILFLFYVTISICLSMKKIHLSLFFFSFLYFWSFVHITVSVSSFHFFFYLI